MDSILVAFGILAAGIHCLALYLERRPLSLAAKPLPVLCLAVSAALWATGPGGNDTYTWLIVCGLVVSLVADIVIEFSFLGGLVAFLAAHVCYVVAFSTGSPGWRPLYALPFLAWGAGVFAFLWPRLGAMKLPVAVYVVVICTMMWRAAARLGASPAASFSEWSALAGAVIFAASDTLIALDRFHAPIRCVRYPIILLYWLGQWGIALSVRTP
jgi:uncharacterized membrane protein YhhN